VWGRCPQPGVPPLHPVLTQLYQEPLGEGIYLFAGIEFRQGNRDRWDAVVGSIVLHLGASPATRRDQKDWNIYLVKV